MEKQVKQRESKDAQDVLWEELEQQLETIRQAFRTGKLMLNSVVIQKSALYLSIDKYIMNVKDNTTQIDHSIEIGPRHRKHRTNKIAQLEITANNLDVTDDFLVSASGRYM